MPIDSFIVKIISRVIGTGQGTLTPWFRSMRSEGVATLLPCALGTLTPRAALETLTPRAALGTITPRVFRAGLIYTPQDEYNYDMTLIVTGVLHPHNLFSHTKQAVCVYSYFLAGQKSNCSIKVIYSQGHARITILYVFAKDTRL